MCGAAFCVGGPNFHRLSAGSLQTGHIQKSDMKRSDLIMDFLTNFLRDQDGAVTVDFVVIVAAICTLGLVVVVAISGGVTNVSNFIVDFLANIQV